MVSTYDDSSSGDVDTDEDNSITKGSHKHVKRFSIIEISTRNSVRKVLIFETSCAEMPSSWEVEFNLSKDARFRNFSMSITLRRTDSGQTPLQGFVISFLSNFNEKLCPMSYYVDSEIPYFESADSDAKREVTVDFLIDDHFRCLFIEGHENFLLDMLLIRTQLLVMGCCRYSRMDKADSLLEKETSIKSFVSVLARREVFC